MSFLLSTKVFKTIPTWPCGPPKAEMLCKKTAFKKGICLTSFVNIKFQINKLGNNKN